LREFDHGDAKKLSMQLSRPRPGPKAKCQLCV